jgi:ribosomal protein S3AE
MTRKLRGIGCEFIFQIKVDKEQMNIIPKRIHIFGFFIRRLIRAGTDYVEDSFDVTCKDAIIKVKPFMITRKKVHKKVRKALREEAKKEIIESMKEKTYEEIFVELLQDNFQKVLSKKLKKIYPLSFFDIRDIYVVK